VGVVVGEGGGGGGGGGSKNSSKNIFKISKYHQNYKNV
jgi:hypothetical protein